MFALAPTRQDLGSHKTNTRKVGAQKPVSQSLLLKQQASLGLDIHQASPEPEHLA